LPDTLEQREKVAPWTPGSTLYRSRWVILALLFTITVINFIDRQTLSVLAPVIRETFHLSNQQYGRIVAALQFGMMSGEFPMGYLMDRWGARLGLSLAVLWWSSATGAQIFARTGAQFGFTRYWMGTGEAGNFSGGIKTIARLFSKTERTLALGIFNSGTMVGATIAPPLIVFLLTRYGFRTAFLVPAMLGFLWLIPWWLLYKREPESLAPAGQPPASLKSMLRESSTWAVMSCRFFNGPVLQFYWYWIPSYLFSVRHMTMLQIGFLGWIPYLLGDIGGVLGGSAAGIMLRRGIPVAKTRRILMYGSGLFCVSSFFVPYATGKVAAMAMIGLAVTADTFLSANMYGAITDLFPDQKVGRVTGLTGVAGGLSGLLFPLLTGYLVDRFSYTPAFAMIAIMPLIGTFLLFLLGRKYRTLENRTPATEPV
jgi:MFS transporter, ACS family, hexuronate transporter